MNVEDTDVIVAGTKLEPILFIVKLFETPVGKLNSLVPGFIIVAPVPT